MRHVMGLLSLVVAVAIGMYFYSQTSRSASGTAGNPKAELDITGVRMDLLGMAQSERAYFAREGRYASLDDLRSSGDLSERSDHRGFYSYSADFNDSGFTITATYGGPPNSGAPPSLSIDQTMQVHQ